jgi:hypothetical protein
MLYQYCAANWNKQFLSNQPRGISVNIECFGDCLCFHHQKLMWWMTQPSAVFIHPHVLTAERTTRQTNTNSCVIHYIISWWQRHKVSKHRIMMPFSHTLPHTAARYASHPTHTSPPYFTCLMNSNINNHSPSWKPYGPSVVGVSTVMEHCSRIMTPRGSDHCSRDLK